jgi:hypothetical protein
MAYAVFDMQAGMCSTATQLSRKIWIHPELQELKGTLRIFAAEFQEDLRGMGIGIPALNRHPAVPTPGLPIHRQCAVCAGLLRRLHPTDMVHHAVPEDLCILSIGLAGLGSLSQNLVRDLDSSHFLAFTGQTWEQHQESEKPSHPHLLLEYAIKEAPKDRPEFEWRSDGPFLHDPPIPR